MCPGEGGGARDPTRGEGCLLAWSAHAGAVVAKLHDELLGHLREASGLPGESDDHYLKYLLGLAAEVQRALVAPTPLGGSPPGAAHTEL